MLVKGKLQPHLGGLPTDPHTGVRRLVFTTELLRMFPGVAIHLLTPGTGRFFQLPSPSQIRVRVVSRKRLIHPWKLWTQEEWQSGYRKVKGFISQHLHGSLEPAMLYPAVGSGKIRQHTDLDGKSFSALLLVRLPVTLLALGGAVAHRLATATLIRTCSFAFAASADRARKPRPGSRVSPTLTTSC